MKKNSIFKYLLILLSSIFISSCHSGNLVRFEISEIEIKDVIYNNIYISKPGTNLNWSDQGTWQRIDESLPFQVPGSHDLVIISKDSSLTIFDDIAEVNASSILIKKDGIFNLPNISPIKLNISNKLIVQGEFKAEGAHNLIFGSYETYGAGLNIYPDGTLKSKGNFSTGLITDFTEYNFKVRIKINGNGVNEIGKIFKLTSGINVNFAYKIIAGGDGFIDIGLTSLGMDQNFGFDRSEKPLISNSNSIVINTPINSEKIIKSRTLAPDFIEKVSAQYAGKWVRFEETGNHYLIIQASPLIESERLKLFLSQDIEKMDHGSNIKIVSGILRGDKYKIIDPVKFSIPDALKSSGLSNAFFYANNAIVNIEYADFSYFGSHLNDVNKINSWSERARRHGITFENFGGADTPSNLIFDNNIISRAAGSSSVGVFDCNNCSFKNIYTWDVHPLINPTGAGQAGHGWEFSNPNNLNFVDNIIINQGDDHIYVDGVVSNLNFKNNFLSVAPTPVGNSTNNLELILSGSSGGISIENNTMLMTDGNINIVCKSCYDVNIKSNIISSTLDNAAANISLVNVRGVVDNNFISNATLGLVIFGSSDVSVSNNILKNHVLSVRNANKLYSNVIIDGSISVNTDFGDLSDGIEYFSNALLGVDKRYGVQFDYLFKAKTSNASAHILNNYFDGRIGDCCKGLIVRINQSDIPLFIRKNYFQNSGGALLLNDINNVFADDNFFYENISFYTNRKSNITPLGIFSEVEITPAGNSNIFGKNLPIYNLNTLNNYNSLVCAGLNKNFNHTFNENIFKFYRARDFIGGLYCD